MWTGAISFGLVNVPVKLFTAVDRKTVRFNQLNSKTGGRIAQKRVDPTTGDEVAYEDIVKGYEIAPDRYVIIEPGDLESVQPTKTRMVEIEDFVDLAEIDPIYFDHPYYLVPDKGADKAYKLLLEAMRETGKVALGRVVIRSKEYLVAVRPKGDLLAMETMLFADEVVPPEKLDDLLPGDVEAGERELKMAKQLVESLSGPFEPEKYADSYREAVLALIEQKAEGKAIAVAPAEEPKAVPDLMAALEASIAEAKQRSKPAKKAAAPKKKKPAKTTA
ncbi:MAG: end-binding protein Ku [Thermoleophilaceae bacterium]|jgi:DNA end-binding protein Ku|nr:end-binding protein Ku [Thermoleophilaceae bacterium]